MIVIIVIITNICSTSPPKKTPKPQSKITARNGWNILGLRNKMFYIILFAIVIVAVVALWSYNLGYRHAWDYSEEVISRKHDDLEHWWNLVTIR